jgi:hypothetical protein
MRLQLIKQAVNFAQENDIDYITETIEVLENISDARGIKDQELDVIGELISNLYGAVEVDKMVKEGTPQKEALNLFMKRVTQAVS